MEPQITDTNANRIDKHCRKVKTKITESAKDVLGERSMREWNIWFDEECMAYIKKRNDAYKQCFSRPTRQRREEYEELRRRVNKVFPKKEKDCPNEGNQQKYVGIHRWRCV